MPTLKETIDSDHGVTLQETNSKTRLLSEKRQLGKNHRLEIEIVRTILPEKIDPIGEYSPVFVKVIETEGNEIYKDYYVFTCDREGIKCVGHLTSTFRNGGWTREMGERDYEELKEFGINLPELVYRKVISKPTSSIIKYSHDN